ncbi:MAG: PAS domain-containing protein [Deltaproteobacteria bacterium]|nr:PAS domain-containing protein [Deltaproteobacteria bacterium]
MDQLDKELPSEIRTWIGRQLFEHVPNNIAVIDRNFNVVVANSQFKAVFGDPAGKHCFEAYKSRDSVCEHCMAARTFEDGKVRVTDEDGFDKNGRPAHYVVHIAPVYDEVGKIPYVIEMSYDLTETKSLQREYNLLFERVPCYLAVINRDLRIVRANALLRETFGECVGEHCYEVYKHRTEKCSDCPAMKTFASGGSYRAEQVGVDKQGGSTHYIVSTSPLARSDHESSHVIEMMLDVTDVHKLSAELVKQSSFRNILIENTLDSLVAVDDAGVVNIFNHAAESLFKVASELVVNTAQGDSFLPREFLSAIENGRTNLSVAETKVVDVEGEEIPVRFSGSILRDGERKIGAAAFFQDLREIKQLESDKLENERLAAVGQTVAQLAHGIKNILTGLAGGMYAIRTGMKSGSEQRTTKGWEMLDRNVERITTLVKGFLSYSRKHVPEMEETDPQELAREIFSLYYAAALKAGVTLLFEGEEGIPVVTVDPSDIHTCLANLVSNAIDACKTSKKEGCGVSLRVKQGDGTIIFEVEDTGSGMEPEIRDKVFNSFFTTKGLGGTGLGLLVTKKIVREHRGRIEVESEPGEGSCFRLELPQDRLNKAV